MSQGFCRTGFDLLAEVAHVPPENIPVFNDDAFRNVIDEVQLQHDQLNSVFENAFARHQENRQQSNAEASESQDDPSLMWYGSEAEATEVMVYHTAILRNKRLLMAYTKRRLDLLRDLRWTHGVIPEQAKVNVTPQEQHFFREYSKLLSKYMRSTEMGGVGLDLTADPDPPNDPYIQVRVMKDYGEVTFSNGSVNLREGLSLWLLRDEAHTLMMEGVLECV